MNAFAYFPTIIYRDEHPEWVEYVKKVTQKYFVEENNLNLEQTENFAESTDLDFFKKYLIESSNNILKDQGYMTEKYEIFLSSLWAQKINFGSGTNIHVHKNSQLCGWFFLDTPEYGSYPIYHDPRMNKEMIEMDYMINQEITFCIPEIHFNNIIPGTILISNSWLKHSLSLNNSKDPTVGLHFIISQRDKSCNT